jgi:O-acetyl-ADP-ribose deacetylase (regulator of RNase III)
MNSTRQIIQRYQALHRERPELFRALAILEQPNAVYPNDALDQPSPETISLHSGGVRILSEDDRMLVAQVGTTRLELVRGDIVRQDVDAVVNAANTDLANGAGVCGALHTAAGARQLEQACQAIGGCPTGEARITPGFGLRARHIIHAVGPRYRPAEKKRVDKLLAGAYRTSLELASKHGLRSIAFPSLSTGIYGFPVEQATPIALETVIGYLTKHQGLELVRFVLRDDTRPVFEEEIRRLASA